MGCHVRACHPGAVQQFLLAFGALRGWRVPAVARGGLMLLPHFHFASLQSLNCKRTPR